MSDVGRFAFEPLLDLCNGRPVGMEVRRCQARDQTEVVARNAVWGTRQLAEFDSGIAIASVLHATDYDPSVPVHIDVLADTVVSARRRIKQLRSSLEVRANGRPVLPVLLEINPALSAAPPDAFVESVEQLRDDGFGIAFDNAGRGFGLDLIAELEPDLVKIDAGLVERLPWEARARTVVQALCDVCRAVGVRISAVGITNPDELAAVRDHGIPWAQGPLIAEMRQRPSTQGIALHPDLMPRIHATVPRPKPLLQAGRTAGSSSAPRVAPPPPARTLAALAQPAVCLSEMVNTESVRQALHDHPQAGGVVLVDTHQRPVGYLDRERFTMAVAGHFGRSLYANRPALALADGPRIISIDADVRTALECCLSGDRGRTYDDVVLVADNEVCVGTVRVIDLMQEATGNGNGGGATSAA
ncbi:EAL domain-containing protein [Pseudonocardia sp. TRM90224]|uniref:EAL domain-containing protein n=1 Tax=Pseudonocardia sp. TRM90224 TaxID=2812678 RepID=UPI001E285C1E|nr:EAL domain-containing protein [Pseudonocardia sp. TRM90224]